jgi:hypothetical protein
MGGNLQGACAGQPRKDIDLDRVQAAAKAGTTAALTALAEGTVQVDIDLTSSRP